MKNNNINTKKKQFAALKEALDIDETLTKAPNKRTRLHNKVKDNIPMVEDYNFMADLIFLPLTAKKYRYLLTIVDLATDECDFEPIKDKEPETILTAMKEIYKRKYLNIPYASLRTDSGNEFKGVFHKYLQDAKILHKISLPARHRQTANIEALNRTIVKFLNGYMNSKQTKTGKSYYEWTDILDTLRIELNKIRKINLPKNPSYTMFNTATKPKFKEGDMVYRLLDEPRNALNEKLGGKFREGDFRYDPIPKKIEKVLYFSGDVPYRYLLNGIHQASYAEYELKKAKEKKEEVSEIKAILNRVYNRKEKKYYYKVWMYDELKKNAGWYLMDDLIKSIGLSMMNELDKIYEDDIKEKGKKKKKKN